jgi:rubrerythrin
MPDSTKAPLTPLEILQAALRREKSAYAFYDGLLKQTTVGFLSALLEELRDAEFHHIKMIEKKLVTLARG